MADPSRSHGFYGIDTGRGLLCLCGKTFATSADLKDHVELLRFAADVVATARANVNDCRLDYVEIQLDKDEVDALAGKLGLPPIDWHPEPCRHVCPTHPTRSVDS